jgi:hypothetical protein
MSRISTPATIDAAPAASRLLLEGVKKQLGVVPNMFRLIANSPGALESYLSLSAALNKGAFPAATRERIALAVAKARLKPAFRQNGTITAGNAFRVRLVREGK